MSLSASTLQLLGCTITPEELEDALSTARKANDDWEKYYLELQQVQRPLKERFREFKENSLAAAATSTSSIMEPTPSLSAKERFRKYEAERVKHEHPESVLLGRKRSQFAV
ncbi:MAG: hypothetical protein J0653_02720 [Deltaproteobacteria bacterium]|nr:hypothetical protein [Deltaproteobacteria bacterium]